MDWSFALRLPGLRDDEAVVRRAGRGAAHRLGARRRRRHARARHACAAGSSARTRTGSTATRRRGCVFGERVVARTRAVRGRSVRTTIDPGLTRAATAALGDRLGGVAVIRPRDGAVLALAGLAVSAPAAARLGVQDHHRRGGARQAGRAAVDRVPRPHGRHARGRHAAQRGRRVVRRHAAELVRPLVQLGLRAAGRRARRAPAGGRRARVRVRREAADPRRRAEHDLAGLRARRRPRRRRRRDRAGPRPRHAARDGQRRRARSRSAAAAPGRGSPRSRRSSAAARCPRARRTRCAR